MSRRPAILGGTPAFPDGLAFARASTPPLERVMERLRPSYESGRLTNGPLARSLEEEAADRLGARHVVAVSSCTAGLMLALRIIAPTGRVVVLPSFTFSASAHAVAWNGLVPGFAECDPATFQLSVGDVESRLDGAGVIMPTHVFGAPCSPERFEALARHAGVALVFDAAHAFGATRRGRPVGVFGDAEVFSLTPTKPLVAGEGGLVATPHDDVARSLRWGRDYGNPGDYDARFVGLNARMSELHAALALEGLPQLDEQLARRRELGARYRRHLDELTGLRPQTVETGDEVTYKDFTIVVDPEYGIDRDALVGALRVEGIDTRCYFSPPIHRQAAYASDSAEDLPVTTELARRVVSLPIWPAMSDVDVDTVAEVLAALHTWAGETVAVGTASRGIT